MDKKDKQIEKYQNMLATNDLLHIKESQEKDEIIDLMANHLYAMQAITHISEFESQEDVKKYFEKIAKEL